MHFTINIALYVTRAYVPRVRFSQSKAGVRKFIYRRSIAIKWTARYLFPTTGKGLFCPPHLPPSLITVDLLIHHVLHFGTPSLISYPPAVDFLAYARHAAFPATLKTERTNARKCHRLNYLYAFPMSSDLLS